MAFGKSSDSGAAIPNPSDNISTSNQDWVTNIAQGQRVGVKMGTGLYKDGVSDINSSEKY